MPDDLDSRVITECLHCLGHINEYNEGKADALALISDNRTYDALLMNFVIIGKCCSRLSSDAKTRCPDVDWRAVKGFRNFIAHDFFRFDLDLIWSTIHADLPILEKDLRQLREIRR